MPFEAEAFFLTENGIAGNLGACAVALVGHGAELDEPEDLFVLARARLCKERISTHFYSPDQRQEYEQRTQAHNSG